VDHARSGEVSYLSAVLRWTARLVVAVAILVALLVAGLPWWLRTAHAHHTVERLLTYILNERVPGTVTVGRLSGDVIDGLHAEQVIVRNPQGELIGHAEWMSARWRPLALLRHHALDELTAYRPIVALDRGTWRVLPPPPKRGPPRGTSIARIISFDGRLSLHGVIFDHIDGTASLDTRSSLDVHGVAGRHDTTVVQGYGVVGWGTHKPGWVATRVRVHDANRVDGTGEIFYTPGKLEGDLDELTLAAPITTALIGGRGPLHARGRLEGAPHDLHVRARANQDGRVLTLRARLDGPGRKGAIDARLTGEGRPLRLRARGRLDGSTLAISTAHAALGDSRLDGAGRLRGGALRATLRVQLAPEEARWLSLHTRAPIVAQLSLDGKPADLAVRTRATLGHAQVQLSARCDLPAHRVRARADVARLQLAELVRNTPQIAITSAVAVDSRWTRGELDAGVRVANGRVTIDGQTFDRLDGAGQVRLARQGEAHIVRLSGRAVNLHGQPPFVTRSAIQWTPEQLTFSDTTVTLDGNHATGELTYVRGGPPASSHLRARIDDLALTPTWIARAVPHQPPRPWVGRATLDGTAGDLTMRIDLNTELGPASASARIQRQPGTLEVTSLVASLGTNRLRGALHHAGDRWTGALDELVLTPAFIRAHVPALDPEWPAHLRGTVDGTRKALDVGLRLDAGPSVVELRGRLLVAARRFRLVGHLDRFDLNVLRRSETHAQGTAELAAQGQLARGGAVGTLTVRHARGFITRSPFYRGLVDARLDGRDIEIMRLGQRLSGELRRGDHQRVRAAQRVGAAARAHRPQRATARPLRRGFDRKTAGRKGQDHLSRAADRLRAAGVPLPHAHRAAAAASRPVTFTGRRRR